MKKIALVLLTLLVAGTMAFAENLLTISGSSDLKWGYEGSWNSQEGWESAFQSIRDDANRSYEGTWGPSDFTLSMEAVNEDGVVIVKAESSLEDTLDENVKVSDNKKDKFSYIEFPNVVEGILGIKLNGEGSISAEYAAGSSSSEDTWVGVAVNTPIGLSANVDLMLVTNGGSLDYNLGANSLPYKGIYDFATAIDVTYATTFGEDGSISVGLGTVIDTAKFYEKIETLADYIADYQPKETTDDNNNGIQDPLASAAQWITDLNTNPDIIFDADGNYTGISTHAYDGAFIEQYMPKDTDQDGEGYLAVPLGLGVDFGIVGVTAGVDFQMGIGVGDDAVNLKDYDNIDLTAANAGDLINAYNFDTANPYGVPMYIGADVGYGTDLGDMSLSVSGSFKYCSDFWKWGDNDDGDAYEYKGDVTAADYTGRPMSIGLDASISNIAGMLGITVGFGMGFGDGEYNHGLGKFAGGNWASMAVDNNGNPKDTDGVGTLTEFVVPGSYDVAGAGQDAFNEAASQYNSTSILVYDVTVGLTLTPIDNLDIADTFSITYDGAGITTGDPSNAEPYFTDFLMEIKNELDVSYGITVGDSVAVTPFAGLDLSIKTQPVTRSYQYDLYTVDPASPDNYYGDNLMSGGAIVPIGVGSRVYDDTSLTELSYEIGVKATVSF